MPLTTITGVVSGIRHSVSDAKFGEIAGTHQLIVFRLDNQSAQIRNKLLPDLQEGDRLTLAGREEQGIFNVFAFRNEATGTIWSIPATPLLLFGWFFIVVGLPLTLVLIGLLFLPMGIIYAHRGTQISSATKMLYPPPA